MNRTRPLNWFARHEARLAWRDTAAMMTAGRPVRARRIIPWVVAVAVGLHALAYVVIRNSVRTDIRADLSTLVIVTATILLLAAAMLSQSMESVTRTLYSRSDLELILSAPVNSGKVFAVRLAAMALSALAISSFLMVPFIDVMVWRDGPRWLGAYGLLVSTSLVTTALAVVLTLGLFHWIGPRRTRLAAQVAAALIGGVIVIGLQIGAMFSVRSLSRISFLGSQAVLARMPGAGSLIWWPARAALGDWWRLISCITVATALFLAIVAFYAPRFAGYVVAASSAAAKASHRKIRDRIFRVASPRASLRRKERVLLLRDPWLMSQSLMQLLYLVPPALLLWHDFGHGRVALILVPVLIMASGQLAGGLAWLTISGEDAPDLVGSAPVAPSQLLRAKVEAVMQCNCIIFCPFVAVLALTSRTQALVIIGGIFAATGTSIVIQLWFRSQAKRSQFRRRHTSSRIATLAEALLSITWAAAGAIAVADSPAALVVVALAVMLLCAVWRLSPARRQ
jgi:ABC-2 type transport system permease protein